MKCDQCGEYGYVYGRKFEREGVTYRRRKCRSDHMWWTQETVVLDKGINPALTTDDMVTLLRNERGN